MQTLNTNDIIFKEPKTFNIKGTKLKYQRLPIEIKYQNNKSGPLIIETPFLFSFGVKERKDMKTD